MPYQHERRRLGDDLTAAESKLRALEQDFSRSIPAAPAFQETRWLLDRQREACRLLRAEIERLENRRKNAINRAVVALLRDTEPQLFTRLVSEAEQRADA